MPIGTRTASVRAWTHDLWIRHLMLYLLSYVCRQQTQAITYLWTLQSPIYIYYVISIHINFQNNGLKFHSVSPGHSNLIIFSIRYHLQSNNNIMMIFPVSLANFRITNKTSTNGNFLYTKTLLLNSYYHLLVWIYKSKELNITINTKMYNLDIRLYAFVLLIL